MERLFNEDDVIWSFSKPIEKPRWYEEDWERLKGENYTVLNGWMFQKDRSRIIDYFEEGDLPKLFDESNVEWSFSKLIETHWYYKDWRYLGKKNYKMLNGWVF